MSVSLLTASLSELYPNSLGRIQGTEASAAALMSLSASSVARTERE